MTEHRPDIMFGNKKSRNLALASFAFVFVAAALMAMPSSSCYVINLMEAGREEPVKTYLNFVTWFGSGGFTMIAAYLTLMLLIMNFARHAFHRPMRKLIIAITSASAALSVFSAAAAVSTICGNETYSDLYYEGDFKWLPAIISFFIVLFMFISFTVQAKECRIWKEHKDDYVQDVIVKAADIKLFSRLLRAGWALSLIGFCVFALADMDGVTVFFFMAIHVLMLLWCIYSVARGNIRHISKKDIKFSAIFIICTIGFFFPFDMIYKPFTGWFAGIEYFIYIIFNLALLALMLVINLIAYVARNVSKTDDNSARGDGL